MNNPNSDTQIEEIAPAVDAELPEAVVEEPPPEFQPLDLKRRLRELLSVPERDRSDEQWDEIIELEIQLAPGNRISGSPLPGGGGGGQPRHNAPRQSKPGNAAAPAAQKKHRPRSKNNRRPRQGGKPGGGEAA